MNEERKEKDAGERLVETARWIKRWQEDRRETNAGMIRRFPGLGSDKTFGKCVKGDLEGLDVERQLTRYQAVWALIEAGGGGEKVGKEELYDDLSAAVQLRRAFLECSREGGNGRFILLQGDTGSGKTSAARSLQEKYGARILFVELSPVAGDSPFNFMLLLLKSMGIEDPPKNAVAAFHKAVSELNQRRRCVVVDELHHAGPKILNTIKSLVNSTPGEFVGLAMPTLWHRMEKAAFEECRQLTGNRLAERIRIERTNVGDLRKMVGRRLPGLKEEEREQAVKYLDQIAPGRGNLAFVRDVLRRAGEMAEGGEIALEDFAAAVKAEVESR